MKFFGYGVGEGYDRSSLNCWGEKEKCLMLSRYRKTIDSSIYTGTAAQIEQCFGKSRCAATSWYGTGRRHVLMISFLVIIIPQAGYRFRPTSVGQLPVY